ncbi:MAG TPA: hypothetical protein VM711_01525 [Sphingomicrobium sp.]|nr:hypothetical protein [Sphingomicrobium sp.]
MHKYWLLAGAAAIVLESGAAAKSLPPTAPPAAVQSLLSCRSIAEPTLRLSCYDKAAQGFAEAVTKREVVVIDKARANEARRSLFGFSIPNFGALLGGGDEMSQIESTVQSVAQNAYGGWTITLADGSTWTQTDDTPVALPPEHGDKVVVKRGSLGSYFVKLGSQPGFKAKRIG